MSFRTLLIANRGEIARRILRTAHAMGIRTVAVHSEPDRGAPFAREADVAVPLGGAAPSETYLHVEKLIDAARRTGAEAVHPGYGFLAEDVGFAEACEAAGLVWVGAPPAAVRAMGSKLEARRLAEAAGVPVLPAAELEGDDAAPWLEAAGTVGLPAFVKASAGGGGRGMRLVRSEAELQEAVRAGRREAVSAFGDGTVYLERALAQPRHVEVQIVADAEGRVAHLFERECSVQRRHQKIVEEAPAPGLSGELREAMCEAAVRLASRVDYRGVGTVEFLLDGDDFRFLEMNTRLQVEHPVTEEVTGVDLVRLQLEIARGRPLPFEQDDLALAGHAIEARLYAEDPRAGYLPSTGVLHRYRHGSTEGIRREDGVAEGEAVTPHYDPLLSKLVAHAATREEAAARLARSLRELEVHGVTTNRDLLTAVLEDPAFLAGDATTAFLEERPDLVAAGPSEEVRRAHLLAAVAWLLERRARDRHLWPFAPPRWRNVPTEPPALEYRAAGGPEAPVHRVAFRTDGDGGFRAGVDGDRVEGRVLAAGPDDVRLDVAGVARHLRVHRIGASIHVNGPEGQSTIVEVPRFPDPTRSVPTADPTAPVPGKVAAVPVEAGQEVAEGQTLVVLEAMKMEWRIEAPGRAVVERVLVRPGQAVDAHQVLVVLCEPEVS